MMISYQSAPPAEGRRGLTCCRYGLLIKNYSLTAAWASIDGRTSPDTGRLMIYP